ncbi:hypothetical protein PG994_003208 [Apiospora phragmitis]|uniref:Uncharacterized protein n=1 Tax=Apiospora phragmitis TaxID=2905665 RepID=A0ABR1W039_9PEZI
MYGMLTLTPGGLRNRIHFGRIVNGGGRLDSIGVRPLLVMEHERLENGNHRFRMRVWKSTGGGATQLEVNHGTADGDKYCNMIGHSDGRMDYVWALFTGQMTLYPQGVLLDRKTLHLAGWDGDGVCDIIHVDESSGNRVQHVWINQYALAGRWEWFQLEDPNRALTCPHQSGPGIHDIPFAEDHDRANLRWADVDGDGRADLIWVDKYTGSGTVWYNNGESPGAPTPGVPARASTGCRRARSSRATWPTPESTTRTWTATGGPTTTPSSARGSTDVMVTAVAVAVARMPRATMVPSSTPPAKSRRVRVPWDRPNFFSLGDSYAAGIGARGGTKGASIHDNYDPDGKCSKYRGAYAQYLARDNMVGTDLHCIACTGAVIEHFYSEKSEKNQQPQWYPSTLGPRDLQGRLGFFLLQWQRRQVQQDCRVYEKFFNAETDKCKIHGLPKIPVTRKLGGDDGKAHRKRLNDLVDRLNNIVKEAVDFVQEWTSYPHDRGNPDVPPRDANFTVFINADALFEGHRHYEPGDPFGTWSRGRFLEPCGPDRQRAEGEGEGGGECEDDPNEEDCPDQGELDINPEDYDEEYELVAFGETCDVNGPGVLGILCILVRAEELEANVLPSSFKKGTHPKSVGHLPRSTSSGTRLESMQDPSHDAGLLEPLLSPSSTFFGTAPKVFSPF